LLLLVHLLMLQWAPRRQMTRAELQDLLLVAVNLEREWLNVDVLAVNLQSEELLQYILAHDTQHKVLLHASADAAPSSSSSSSSSSNTAQLVEQLITTAVIRSHATLAPALAATPAAQQFSPHQVAQLMYTKKLNLSFVAYFHAFTNKSGPTFEATSSAISFIVLSHFVPARSHNPMLLFLTAFGKFFCKSLR
jgi:hypothetical protein